MPRFLGLDVQTDVLCASGTRRASFPARDLLACTAVLSPTEPESLTVTVQRSDARCAELLIGRVLRTCFDPTSDDREWDIVALEDDDTTDALTITAQPIGLRLARRLYEAADGATGAPVFEINAVGITAADAIDDYVLPTLGARGMTWVTRGTVDASNAFDLTGQWASILEIVRALCEPGRANAEWQLRRNGAVDYKIDLRTQLNGTADTLRVRSRVNLLQHSRRRSVLEAVTRVIPRGSERAQQRTMADHLWRVAAVGSDYLELEDPAGGDDPIAYDDQLNDLYVAGFGSTTCSPVQVLDTIASSQRVQLPSVAGYTAGDLLRVLVGSTANGARLTSLRHPTQAAAPSAGGLGDLAEFLDLPSLRGDCNFVPNPFMRTWTTAGNPPDGWTVSAGTPANLTQSRETTVVRASPYTLRLQTTGATTLYVETGDIPLWAIVGRRHFAALWFYVDAVPAAATSALVFDLVTSAGVKILELGRWVRNTDDLDTWLRMEAGPLNLESVTTKVRIRMTVTTTTGGSAASGWNVLVSNAMFAESEIAVEDIEGAGGTRLWQAANRRLAEASSPVRNQTVRVADLEADDPDVFASLKVVPGQPCEVTDLVLLEATTQRVLEYRPDYLAPLRSEIRIGVPQATAVQALAPGGLEPIADSGATAASEMLAIEASFDEDGQLFVRVVGDADTAAIYCVVSTSGEPTEATLMQATPTAGRQGEFSFAGPYALGETVYVAARGAASGAGLNGLSEVIRARVVRGNAPATKTIRLPAQGVLASTNPATENGIMVSGYYKWTVALTPHNGFIPPPKGATLTAVRARVYVVNTGGFTADELYLSIDRVGNDGGITVLGSGDVNSNTNAWETLEVSSLSEDTSGDRSYRVEFNGVTGTGGTPGLAEFRVAWIEYDLDVPNFNIST